MKKQNVKVLAACSTAIFLASSWIGVASAVECVSPDLAMSCYRTIQEAVNAADLAEVVEVYPGNYRENVSVDTAGVQVVGKGVIPGSAVVSADRDNPVISLNAPKVKLENVSVVGGSAGIAVTGAKATITDVRVRDSATGITISAYGARVINSSIQLIDTVGIAATGADLLVQSSLIERVGGICVEVNGDGAVIDRSRIIDCGAEGVKISGSAASVLESDFLVAVNSMISVFGPGARIRGNTIQGGRERSIDVYSDVPIVVDNSVIDSKEGIDVACDICAGGLVTGNVVSGTYDCPGITVNAGSGGLQVLNNTSRNNKTGGFILYGPKLVVRGNQAVNNGRSGFEVRSPSPNVKLFDNQANKNAEHGILIGSGVTGTIVYRNRAHLNGGTDYSNAGTGTIRGTGTNRNYFGTTGH